MIASVIARRRGHYEPSPEVRKSAVRASGSAHTGCLLSVECRRCRLHQAMSAQPVRTLRADPQKRTMLVPARPAQFRHRETFIRGARLVQTGPSNANSQIARASTAQSVRGSGWYFSASMSDARSVRCAI